MCGAQICVLKSGRKASWRDTAESLLFAVSDVCVTSVASETPALVTVGNIQSFARPKEPIQSRLSSAAGSNAGPAVPTLSEMSQTRGEEGREQNSKK